MKYKSDKPNAMILPLPTPQSADEDAVRFIDLSKYDRFFADLKSGFPTPPLPESFPPPMAGAGRAIDSKLRVQRVGNFDASFVPKMSDFDRLDSRFVISKDVWAKLPEYKDWGFAVFQLHELDGEPHPMAFEFKTRLPDTIFFPTVHIHDGDVHPREDFQHTLYSQHAAFDAIVGPASLRADKATRMVRSTKTADDFVEIEKTKGIVDGGLLVHRKSMNGKYPNKDVWIAAKGDTTKKRFGAVKTVLPLGMLLPVTWIIRRRQALQRKPPVN